MVKISMSNRSCMLLAVVCALSVLAVRVNAQELDKEVYVIRPYEPNLTEADKISFLPEITDVPAPPVAFNYAISPSRIQTSLAIDPINPARMVAVSLPKIYNSWLKLGLGNFLTPLAEFNISNVRSREFAYGAYLHHKSSRSNIVLANDDKAPGGYVHNNASLYGKRLYTNAVLDIDLHFQHRGFNYYGYNTEKFAGPPPEIDRDSVRQNTYLAGLKAGIASAYTDSSHLNYALQVGYDFFTDRQQNIENIVSVNTGIDKNLGGLQAGIKIGVDHFSLRSEIDTSANTIVRVNPWIGKRKTDWRFTLGFEAVSDITEISNFYLYPKVHLEIIIVDNVLVPFLGASGELLNSNYQQLTTENPFVIPGTRLKNASRNLIVYGGIKGSISNAIRFRADVNFSVNKDMHFFINDTVSTLENEFTTAYDDVDLVVYHGQLTVQPNNSMEFTLDGNFYDYNTVNLAKPWHKPEYDISLSALYRLRDKITINGDATLLGNRYTSNRFWPDGIQELEAVLDLNLKFQYHYSRMLTVFFDIYNISNRSYMTWNQYPSQRFNFMGGFTYKL